MNIDKLAEILRSNPSRFPEALTEYLEDGGDINAKDDETYPLLFWAINENRLAAVTLLLEKSADINIDYIASEMAGLNAAPIHTAMQKSTFTRDFSIYNLLIKHPDLDPNIQYPPIGETALHVAAMIGNLNFIEDLLRRGAQINITLNNGVNNPPLATAAYNGHTEAIKYLISQGADVEALLSDPHLSSKMRPVVYQALLECHRAIPTPSTPYDTIVAEEVAQHNARQAEALAAHLKETDTALKKGKIYSVIRSIIHSYLYFDPIPKQAQEGKEGTVNPEPISKIKHSTTQPPTQTSLVSRLGNWLWDLWIRFRTFIRNTFFKAKTENKTQGANRKETIPATINQGQKVDANLPEKTTIKSQLANTEQGVEKRGNSPSIK